MVPQRLKLKQYKMFDFEGNAHMTLQKPNTHAQIAKTKSTHNTGLSRLRT